VNPCCLCIPLKWMERDGVKGGRRSPGVGGRQDKKLAIIGRIFVGFV